VKDPQEPVPFPWIESINQQKSVDGAIGLPVSGCDAVFPKSKGGRLILFIVVMGNSITYVQKDIGDILSSSSQLAF